MALLIELSNEDKKQILAGFLENLWRISNKDYQKRIWIEGRGPECHDFDEAVNDFFDEGDSILENYKDFGLTDKQHQMLANFRNIFDAFVIESRQYSSPDFINTLEWGKITEAAKEVLLAFNYQKPS